MTLSQFKQFNQMPPLAEQLQCCVKPLSRKQREIADRHQLLLNASRKLFIEQGYFNVTMDTIARATEYSKGTIYQHFACKECVIAELYIQFLALIEQIFSNIAVSDKHSARFQMGIVLEAFILIHERLPDDIQIKNLAVSQAFGTKVKPELIERIKRLEQSNTQLVIDLVQLALDNNELELREGAKVQDIAFGCWALGQGTYWLFNNNAIPDNLHLSSAAGLLRENANFYLDGVGWKKIELNSSHQQILVSHLTTFNQIIDAYHE
jgi:AcrR family transcriptional regulator